jgi:hypothetical protein
LRENLQAGRLQLTGEVLDELNAIGEAGGEV